VADRRSTDAPIDGNVCDRAGVQQKSGITEVLPPSCLKLPPTWLPPAFTAPCR